MNKYLYLSLYKYTYINIHTVLNLNRKWCYGLAGLVNATPEFHTVIGARDDWQHTLRYRLWKRDWFSPNGLTMGPPRHHYHSQTLLLWHAAPPLRTLKIKKNLPPHFPSELLPCQVSGWILIRTCNPLKLSSGFPSRSIPLWDIILIHDLAVRTLSD